MYNSEQAYLDILRELVAKAETKGFRECRDGHQRCSLFGRSLRFNLKEGFPLLTHKKVFLRGAFEELMWMLRGQTDSKILEEKNVFIWKLWGDILTEYGFEKGELGNIYGHQWRNFGATLVDMWDCAWDEIYQEEIKGFDQIAWLQNEIKTNPTSSRLLLTAWNPNDFLVKGRAALPSCHVLTQLFVEDGELSCKLTQRSGDFIVGNPLNFAFYALFTHMMAQQCDLDVGEFIWDVGDVHLYSDQLDMAREILTRKTHDFPILELNKADDLFSYEWSDVNILNYQHEAAIKIPVAK